MGNAALWESRAEEMCFSTDWAISSGFCEKVTLESLGPHGQWLAVSVPGSSTARKRDCLQTALVFRALTPLHHIWSFGLCERFVVLNSPHL